MFCARFVWKRQEVRENFYEITDVFCGNMSVVELWNLQKSSIFKHICRIMTKKRVVFYLIFGENAVKIKKEIISEEYE